MNKYKKQLRIRSRHYTASGSKRLTLMKRDYYCKIKQTPQLETYTITFKIPGARHKIYYRPIAQ